MKSNHKVSRTVAAILTASAAHAALAAAPPSAAIAIPAAGSSQLQEVVVTAQRRTQNIQNVPITMEALSGKTLRDLHVQTFSGYVKYLPNVTTGSAGPGNGLIFMRGLSDGVVAAQGQGTIGNFPNVAVYLDDSSALQPGRDLDVYAVDLKRVEVLEGPQGTLFGAGAEAGVVRFITNKPNLYATQVNVNGGYGVTAHGDPNHNLNAVFNWPIIPGKLAARVVWFTDHRGGYINNLPATFSRSPHDVGLVYENGGVVPTNSVTINNYQIASNAINPLDYGGLRAEVKYKINDDWNVLVSEMYQDMNAQGVFYEMPYASYGSNAGSAQAYVVPGSISAQNPAGKIVGPYHGAALPPLSVNLFNPSYDKDRWENTEIRVKGKVGPLSLVYAGVYLDRHTDQAGDYTNYARGRYGYYYQCTGVSFSATSGNAGASCYSPRSAWHDTTHNTHFSQEIRLSTPDDWRLRGVAGLYYEDYKLDGLTQWNYNTLPQCSPTGATTGCFLPKVTFPSMPYQSGSNGFSTHPAFFDDSERTFIQRAAYVSASFDIVPHKLTITGGVRYFQMSSSETGGSEGSFYCEKYTASSYYGQCLSSNVTDFNPNDSSLGALANDPHLVYTTTNHLRETGMRGRANLTWQITPQIMAYYTYSQGFRPGGFNRGTGLYLPDKNGNPQWRRPATYLSDNLTNNEIGWKTRWWNNRLQVDGSVYQENWSHTQVDVFCPQCGFGNLSFVTNGADYRVRGMEIAFDALPMRGLTVHAAASWNSGEQTNAPHLLDNVAGSTNYGKPISVYYSAGQGISVPNVFGAMGTPLANSPPFSVNMRVRYEWAMGPYLPFVQVGFQHRAHSYSPTGEIETDVQPSWTTYDASAGVSEGPWTVSVVGTNLTNENKSLFTSRRQFILTETPMRPRVVELTFSYHYSSR